MTISNHTVAIKIREVFQSWPAVPALTGYTSPEELQRDYQRQSGPTHWFDTDTLQFFGSRNRELVAPGMMIELQSKAPAGCPRYVVIAWVLHYTAHHDPQLAPGRITPQNIGAFHTRAEARRYALCAAEVWPSLTL